MEKQRGITRRSAIKTASILTGGLAVSSAVRIPSEASAHSDSPTPAGIDKSDSNNPTTIVSDKAAIVETTAGKVRGYTHNGIYTFKGIPYAAPAGGNARFTPPGKVTPWPGIRSSLQYGFVCPQSKWAGPAGDEMAFLISWDRGLPGEDCLRVNVWTENINDHLKRPVMFWLHGGGFQTGSSQELKSYDGENLARRGVVLVSINHRLGPLGYLDLSAYDERYAQAANVGMLDIVAALEWVRENIANFGGDPNNVTIFGQSGGGGKVGTLMAMPAAHGLFHKASIHSGSMLRALTADKSQKIAAAVVRELGLTKANIGELHTMPFDRLNGAAEEALRKLSPPPGPIDMRKMADQLGWGPVVDGGVLPQHPFDPVAPAISKDVPLLVGTVLNEFTGSLDHPENELWTDDDVKKQLAPIYGEKTTEVLTVFRRIYPHLKPLDVYSRISTAPIRQSAVDQATRKAAQDAAPAYLWWLTWQSPLLDGRMRAPHCSDLAFVFDNSDRCETHTGGGARPRALAAKVSQAWVNFAKTGNPNHSGLPNWPAFAPGKCQTMIFDDACEARENPDTEERRMIQS
jgi:para-nitrobenzyl esterase